MPRQPDDVRSPGQSRHPAARPRLQILTLLGLRGMSPQCPLLGENEKRDAWREHWSHWHGAEGKLDFRTSHILTAFAKSVSPHSYKGRMKSDWVWIARPLRSRHFRP